MDTTSRLAAGLFHITNALRKFRLETSRKSDLYQGEIAILLGIKNAQMEKHPISSPSELSDNLGISRPNMTGILNSLEKKGYLTRELCPDDRRKLLIVLTEKGEKVACEKFEAFWDIIQYVSDRLGPEESARFAGYLEKVQAIIQNYVEKEL